MRKGDFVEIIRVYVGENMYGYTGQDMDWTEEYTGHETIPAHTPLYHFSDRKIKKFIDKETCFMESSDNNSGHYYALSFVEPVRLATYGQGEVRLKLEPGMKIQYIGYRK